jgi:hypothetical protein
VSDSPDNPKTEVQRLFVDEAGDPVLFANRRTAIVGKPGCSRFFMIGKLEASDPPALARKLTVLRQELIADPYFAGVESFKPERRKTASHFHAKDDLPEVRYRVFELLRSEGDALRFHAVVCDKANVLREVQQRNAVDPEYWYSPNELYDGLMRSLFGKLHRLADRYHVCVARRGKSDRNEALRQAIDHAERDFTAKFGFGRGGPDAWHIEVSSPERDVPLQAVDYFLWAVQRFYEPRVDNATGQDLREARFIEMLWPQIGEVHDLHHGPKHGTFYTAKHPLKLEERFGPATGKKKKP